METQTSGTPDKSGHDFSKKKLRKMVSDSNTSKTSSEPEFSEMHELDSGLATVEGQMEANPHLTEEQAKTAAKREYNRRNAARARIRNKTMVKDLQSKVSELTQFSEELQRKNELLQARLDVLIKQNEELVACCDQRTTLPAPAHLPDAVSNDMLNLIRARQSASLHGGIGAAGNDSEVASQLLASAISQQQGTDQMSIAKVLADQRISASSADSAKTRLQAFLPTLGASALRQANMGTSVARTIIGGARLPSEETRLARFFQGIQGAGTRAGLLGSLPAGATRSTTPSTGLAAGLQALGQSSLSTAGQRSAGSVPLGNLPPQALYSILRRQQSRQAPSPPDNI